jgi:hypothetical protein
MEDIHAHLEKIRSDAAECILLSALVPDGKREVFARTAEHLNALASAVEKTIATNGADVVRAAKGVEAIATDIAAAPSQQQAARPRRMLPWLLVIVLGVVIGGAFFWANNPMKQYSLIASLRSKHEPSPALSQDETKQLITTLLAREQGENKKLMEQLNALAARVDNAERALDNLEAARAAAVVDSSNQEPLGTIEKPATTEAKHSPPEDMPVRPEQNRTSALENPAPAKQSDGLAHVGGPLVEPVDQVGAISVARRQARLDPRKRIIGPPGCTQFRSFDADSGTYTTFEGRRRPCQ